MGSIVDSQMSGSAGVPYQELHHREAFTAQTLAKHEHVSGRHVAKVVVMMVDGEPVELILPANRLVVLERVAGMLGARDVRFATEDEMVKIFPGCEVGAVPPLRHWVGVELVMDESMHVSGDMIFPAATHSDAIQAAVRGVVPDGSSAGRVVQRAGDSHHRLMARADA